MNCLGAVFCVVLRIYGHLCYKHLKNAVQGLRITPPKTDDEKNAYQGCPEDQLLLSKGLFVGIALTAFLKKEINILFSALRHDITEFV